MDKILEINNLCYQEFNNINITFNKGLFYYIVGPNKSGKTMLFRNITSLNLTNNMIICNNITLNSNTQKFYLRNIGVVERVHDYSFNYQSVYHEMLYPLLNIGYSQINAKKRIKEVLDYFNFSYIFDKKIKDLNLYEKQELLIIIALLHQPMILIMDNVLELFSHNKRKEIIFILKKLINEGLTVINFTVSLNDIMASDKIILLSNYKIIKETTYEELYDNDKLFYENDLEIPFMIDIVNKLKMYNLINKKYTNMKELVDSLWD